MDMKETSTQQEVKRNYLSATIQCRCPRCRQGHLFINKNPYSKNNLKMPKACPVCGQPTEIEVGFYTGAGYAAYALTVAGTVSVFVAWYVLIGFTFKEGDNRIWWCMGTAIFSLIALTPVYMRLARSMWISFFVKYDPEWKEHPLNESAFERINDIGMEQ